MSSIPTHIKLFMSEVNNLEDIYYLYFVKYKYENFSTKFRQSYLIYDSFQFHIINEMAEGVQDGSDLLLLNSASLARVKHGESFL